MELKSVVSWEYVFLTFFSEYFFLEKNNGTLKKLQDIHLMAVIRTFLFLLTNITEVMEGNMTVLCLKVLTSYLIFTFQTVSSKQRQNKKAGLGKQSYEPSFHHFSPLLNRIKQNHLIGWIVSKCCDVIRQQLLTLTDTETDVGLQESVHPALRANRLSSWSNVSRLEATMIIFGFIQSAGSSMEHWEMWRQQFCPKSWYWNKLGNNSVVLIGPFFSVLWVFLQDKLITLYKLI